MRNEHAKIKEHDFLQKEKTVLSFSGAVKGLELNASAENIEICVGILGLLRGTEALNHDGAVNVDVNL